jgi:hypothetical protein
MELGDGQVAGLPNPLLAPRLFDALKTLDEKL